LPLFVRHSPLFWRRIGGLPSQRRDLFAIRNIKEPEKGAVVGERACKLRGATRVSLGTDPTEARRAIIRLNYRIGENCSHAVKPLVRSMKCQSIGARGIVFAILIYDTDTAREANQITENVMLCSKTPLHIVGLITQLIQGITHYRSFARERATKRGRKRERERERQWARTKAFFSKVYPGASKRSGDSLIAWLLCARPGSLLRKRACAYADAHVLETRTQGSVEHLTTGCQSVSQAHPLSQRRKYCNCTRGVSSVT
jgi:hypothetical protein